ncbi:MAG TPA: ABC transporter ATP-binding protein, partial [Rhodobacteraceae bacterium]|nr:ABC transporter ATP-binding protein [Paracoccaceae bacterium]
STPQTPSRELMVWIWRGYLRKHLGVILFAVFFMVLEGGSVGAISYMMKPMFDEIFIQGNSGALFGVAVIFLLIFTVRGVSGAIQKVLLTRVSQKAAAQLRLDLLRRLVRQDSGFHQSHPPGFLIQRMQSDVNSVNNVWRAIILGAGRDAVSFVALMYVAIG